MGNDIILQNAGMRLVIGENCILKSLICLENGQECLKADEEMALFSVTQERPFNNEIKLIHPNKQTVFQGNRLRREKNLLIVGFEVIPYEAVLEIREAEQYIAFTLKDFIVHPDDYPGLKMSPPPVSQFRLMQLPVRERKYFGEWLNVVWDEETAVNVLAVSPLADIDGEKRRGCRVLTAGALSDYELKGCTAALICTPSGKLLDAIDALEADYKLPRGVQSRRNPAIHRSAYWYRQVTPDNVDEHIRFAKQGGFRHMLMYYTSFFKEEKGYSLCGNYDYRPEYPDGAKDVKAMLDKIKVAGIVPGIHFLQTHIGKLSRYITPIADPRLNLTRLFTLAKPLSETDTEVTVEQNPAGTVMEENCRVLKMDGELIHFTAYTETPPYRFTGCTRGHWNTAVTAHPAGCRGGILDVSEFGATSCYIDERTSLQDEVAEKLAEVYNAGFEFIYFDGSEGTNPPFGIEVPRGQYRVYQKLRKPPLLAEGAAKAHFNWHMLSGGNAFDVFPTDIFKKMIDRYPVEGAQFVRQDFTRINFGWWAYYQDTQPDVYEYGESRAAGWDCPVTMMANPDLFKSNPRTDDNLEVLRRWEDVREKNWLTDEQKAMLQKTGQEHILLINEEGEYELCPYEKIAETPENLSAFLFERKNRQYVVYWHRTGKGTFSLPLLPGMKLEKELGREIDALEKDGEGRIKLPAEGRRYLSSDASAAEIRAAFAAARWA